LPHERVHRIALLPTIDHAVHLREAGEGPIDLVRGLAGLALRLRAGSGLTADVARATPEGRERIEPPAITSRLRMPAASAPRRPAARRRPDT